MKLFIRAMTCLSVLLIAESLEACSTCRDVGTIEKREECRACRGRGKTVTWKARVCLSCNGTGSKTGAGVSFDGVIYTIRQTHSCRNCRGKGEIKEKVDIPCVTCAGQGVLVERVPCPACTKKPVADVTFQPLSADDGASGSSKVQNVQVETCKLCWPGGKIKRTIACDQCKRGYCHKKETVSGKDVFKCGKCGKVCTGRFTPCSCEKPDCSSCDGTLKRVLSESCKLCGGDGTITPLERARAKENR